MAPRSSADSRSKKWWIQYFFPCVASSAHLINYLFLCFFLYFLSFLFSFFLIFFFFLCWLVSYLYLFCLFNAYISQNEGRYCEQFLHKIFNLLKWLDTIAPSRLLLRNKGFFILNRKLYCFANTNYKSCIKQTAHALRNGSPWKRITYF